MAFVRVRISCEGRLVRVHTLWLVRAKPLKQCGFGGIEFSATRVSGRRPPAAAARGNETGAGRLTLKSGSACSCFCLAAGAHHLHV